VATRGRRDLRPAPHPRRSDTPAPAVDRIIGRELQSSWDQHIQHVRQRIAAKRAEHDSAAADSDAEWAEADAVNAVDFAEAAVVEAEYAVLDAALARTKADAMASS
jgi:hypothetical protein